jgi:hypothetical protein
MGEAAEMMLDGTCCSSCGEYLGGDEGYPVQCAACRQAERGSGGGERRDDRPQLEWLRIKAGQLDKIGPFVKDQPVNTYAGPRLDKKGSWIILLGWDDRPDSDWGRFKGNRAALWFGTDEDLAKKGEAEVRKALGWQGETA